jgi:hypothetical protein
MIDLAADESHRFGPTNRWNGEDGVSVPFWNYVFGTPLLRGR